MQEETIPAPALPLLFAENFTLCGKVPKPTDGPRKFTYCVLGYLARTTKTICTSIRLMRAVGRLTDRGIGIAAAIPRHFPIFPD